MRLHARKPNYNQLPSNDLAARPRVTSFITTWSPVRFRPGGLFPGSSVVEHEYLLSPKFSRSPIRNLTLGRPAARTPDSESGDGGASPPPGANGSSPRPACHEHQDQPTNSRISKKIYPGSEAWSYFAITETARSNPQFSPGPVTTTTNATRGGTAIE